MNIPPQPVSLRQPNASASLVIVPEELIAEVLSWHTVKSLIKMGCVCKSWKTLISDPYFVKMHLEKSSRNPRLTLIEGSSFVNISVSSFVQNPRIPITHKYLLSIEEPTFPTKICCLLRNRLFYHVKMVGSCIGLICFACFSYSKDHNCLCFWNPATDKFSDQFWFGSSSVYFLNYSFSSFNSLKLSFGYDSSSDTYKVVALHQERAKVTVFSSGKNAWRNIQQFPVTPHFRSNDGVYLSRSLNWIVIRNNSGTVYHSPDESIEQFVIISLDLSTETYTQLLLPPDFDEVPLCDPSLCVLRNSLCFSHDFKLTHFVIWQMKEFGVQESWTQYLKISYHNFLISYDTSLVNLRWFPLYLSENGDTLILSHDKGRQAIVYNRKDNRVERSRLANKYYWLSAKYHVESLVSYC